MIGLDELQLAARNHGMPLELLREPVTPIGLHYLLIHYDIPHVDVDRWLLDVAGTTYTIGELRALPSHEVISTMECAGNGRARMEPRAISQPWLSEAIGTGRWRGVRLRDVLEPPDGTVEILFTGLDRGIEGGEEQLFQRSLSLEDARREDVILAFELNGVPLPPQHGFPLRLLVPGWYGMTNVKWLQRIEYLDEPFTGYQQARGYHFRRSDDDAGEPLTWIAPRALMVPPGIPDFMSRDRTIEPGRVQLQGRAWSGHAPVAAVEVRVDDGDWQPATLDVELGRWAWRGWSFEWDALPGEHVLACRARDESGRVQPDEAEWNVGGYANNGVQRVSVAVRD